MSLKLLLHERHCQKNEKASHRMGKVFQKIYLTKGFYPQYIKSSLQLNKKKINTPIKKWDEDLDTSTRKYCYTY